MRHSRDRLLTTHAGSLPRPPALADLMLAGERGEAVDRMGLEALIDQAVPAVVAAQIDAGLTIINDGEVSKPSYSTYVKDRLTGFGEERVPLSAARVVDPDFPDFAVGRGSLDSVNLSAPVCVGPVSPRDLLAVHRDVRRLATAVHDHQAVIEPFLTAVSPGQVSRFMLNRHYPSHEAYVYALADAMRGEYQAIIDAGVVLQLDCPDLASGRSAGPFATLPLSEWKKTAQLHVEALNHATRGLPREQLRVHLCWGNYAGPHQRDVELRDILDLALAVRCGALSFEAANPRHAHEWPVWQDAAVPDDLILIPGVIESSSPYVEHPELVAERLTNFASVVGKERVIAGIDCGFGTFVGAGSIPPSIIWAKLRTLAQGADIASGRLWAAPHIAAARPSDSV